MMTFAIAGLLLFGQQVQTAPPTTKILGKNVPIEFLLGGPCGSTTAFVEASGWKWQVLPDGGIGRRFRKDGGWQDLKDLYASAQAAAGRTPYRIKVVIIQNAVSMRQSPIGVVRHRWASIDGDELETVTKSLATLKGSIEGATNGAYDVSLDVTVDDDTFTDFDHLLAPSQGTPLPGSPKSVHLGLLGAPIGPASDTGRYIAEMFAPQFNDERFETDDGVYRGPYAAVFVIHPGLPLQDQVTLVDHTPLVAIDYFRFSDIEASRSLPTALFEGWKKSVVALLQGSDGVSTNLETADEYEFPRVVCGPVWQSLVAQGLRTAGTERSLSSVASTALNDLSRASLKAVTGGDRPGRPVVESSANPGRSLVSLEHFDYVVAQSPSQASFNILGIALNSGPDYFEVDASPATLQSAMRLGNSPGPAPAVGEQAGTVVGDFESKAVAGPNGAPAWEVKFKRLETRGYVLLAKGSPLIPKGPQSFLSFDIKLSTDENILLSLHDRNGEEIGRVLLGGDMAGPKEFLSGKGLYDSSVPADDQWHSIVVPISALEMNEDVYEVRIGGGDDRTSRGDATFIVTTPVVKDSGSGTLATSAPSPALEIAQFTDQMTADNAPYDQSYLREFRNRAACRRVQRFRHP